MHVNPQRNRKQTWLVGLLIYMKHIHWRLKSGTSITRKWKDIHMGTTNGMCWVFLFYSPGAHKKHSNKNSNSMATWFCCYPSYGKSIATIFCTWHPAMPLWHVISVVENRFPVINLQQLKSIVESDLLVKRVSRMGPMKKLDGGRYNNMACETTVMLCVHSYQYST